MAPSSSTYGLSLIELLDDGWHSRSVWQAPETLPSLPKNVLPVHGHQRSSLDYLKQCDYPGTALLPAPEDDQEEYPPPRPPHPSFCKQQSDGLLVSTQAEALSLAAATQAAANPDRPLPVLPLEHLLRHPSMCIQDAARTNSAGPGSGAATAAGSPRRSSSGPNAVPVQGAADAALRHSLYRTKSRPGSMIFGMSMSAMEDGFYMEVESQRDDELEGAVQGGQRRWPHNVAVPGDNSAHAGTQCYELRGEDTAGDGGGGGRDSGRGGGWEKQQHQLPVSELMAMLKQHAKPAPPAPAWQQQQHQQQHQQHSEAAAAAAAANGPLARPQAADADAARGGGGGTATNGAAHHHKQPAKGSGADDGCGAGFVGRDQTGPAPPPASHALSDSSCCNGGGKDDDAVTSPSFRAAQKDQPPPSTPLLLLHSGAGQPWPDLYDSHTALSTACYTSPSDHPVELVSNAASATPSTLHSAMHSLEVVAAAALAAARQVQQDGAGMTTKPIAAGVKPGSITVVRRHMGSSGRYEIVPYPLYEPLLADTQDASRVCQPVRVVGFTIRDEL